MDPPKNISKQACYGSHSRKIRKNIRQILESDVKPEDIHLIGKFWCNNCRAKYKKDQEVMLSTRPTVSDSAHASSSTSNVGSEFEAASTSESCMVSSIPTTSSEATSFLPDDPNEGNKKKCSFGQEFNEDCSDEDLFMPVKLLPKSDSLALSYVTNIWCLPEDSNICEKHLEKFIGEALRPGEGKHVNCCDIFGVHDERTVGSELRGASTLHVVKAKICGKTLFKGDLICRYCRRLLDETVDKKSKDVGDNASEPTLSQLSVQSFGISPSVIKEELKEDMKHFGLSPIDPGQTNYRESGKIRYAKRKMEQIESAVRKKVCISLDIQESEIYKLQAEHDTAVTDLNSILTSVKDKLATADYRTRIQLLTVCPSSWSTRFASKYFKVSRHTITLSRRLLATDGILAKPKRHRGRPLPESEKQIVQDFYCDDANARLMPGRKDFVSMGGGKRAQKRLLLCNLSELYALFKEQNPSISIGFSKFCSLRPKFCVSAGSAGTHNVCVCTKHQNLKLQLYALKLDESLKNLISSSVCSSETRDCMLGVCSECPKEEDIVNTLTQEVEKIWKIREEGDYDADEQIEDNFDYLNEEVEVSWWTSTDRADLLCKSISLQDLINETAKNLKKVIPHHFISKTQGKYFKDMRETLTEQQSIVAMDFSMNYTCDIQDSSQNHHWSKKQCTVHPVVIYVKGSDGEISSKSLSFISDDVTHDVVLVQCFQDITIKYIQENYPAVKEIMYMTDGCAAQYKNCNSFLHLCKHEEMYGMKASWCFYATSHGKSTCDGIGGTIKREARRASLQRAYKNQITSAHKLFEFCCQSNISNNIKCFYVSKEEVEKRREIGKTDPDVAFTVPGTQSFHHFIPLSGSTIGCKRVSTDDFFGLVHILSDRDVRRETWEVNSFVAVLVESKIFIGLITDVNEDEKEADVSLLHPPLPASLVNWRTVFTWREDVMSYVSPIPNLICTVPLVEGENNTYSLPLEEVLKVKQLGNIRKKTILKQ